MTLPAAATLLVLLLAPPGAASDAAAVRRELEALRAGLEAEVSAARAPTERGAAAGPRVYRLEGYGAVVVLAARSLPRVRPGAAERQRSRAMAEASRGLEEALRIATAPDLRRQIEETLAALRRAQRETPAPSPPGAPAVPGAAPEMPSVMNLVSDPDGTMDFVYMHEQAEEFRREADLLRARAQRDLLRSLGVEEPPGPEVTAAATPAPPGPPGLPAAPRAARPAGAPWRLFSIEAADDGVTPDEVVARVRAALVRGLADPRGDLAVLRPDDFIVVAVDFLPRVFEGRRSVRTLQARVRRRDLDARRAGTITAEELASRIAFVEF